MSERELKTVIRCGETTCAEEPGKFCQMIVMTRCGTDVSCKLFSDWLADFGGFSMKPIPLQNSKEDGTGWTLRHPKCIEAEKRARRQCDHFVLPDEKFGCDMGE